MEEGAVEEELELVELLPDPELVDAWLELPEAVLWELEEVVLPLHPVAAAIIAHTVRKQKALLNGLLFFI